MQRSQRMRTSRCAIVARKVDLRRKPSTPRSRRRGSAAAAVSVCSVVKTRWPVSAAWIAILAVSASRISPTMITSGSWRTKARSAVAKVRPIDGFTCDWLTPLDLVLDRILDGQDLAGRLIEHRQHGRERRGFAAAGRPGDDDHAMRQRQKMFHPALRLFRKGRAWRARAVRDRAATAGPPPTRRAGSAWSQRGYRYRSGRRATARRRPAANAVRRYSSRTKS